MSVLASDIECRLSGLVTLTYEDFYRQLASLTGETTGIMRANSFAWVNIVLGQISGSFDPDYLECRTQIQSSDPYPGIDDTDTPKIHVRRGEREFSITSGTLLPSFAGRSVKIGSSDMRYEVRSIDSTTTGKLRQHSEVERMPSEGLPVVFFADELSLPGNFGRMRILTQMSDGRHLREDATLPVTARLSQSPEAYRVTESNMVRFWPAPDRATTFEVRYYQAFEFKDDDPEAFLKIPDKWLGALLMGAASLYWMSAPGDRSSLSKANHFTQHFMAAKQDILKDKYAGSSGLAMFVPFEPIGMSANMHDDDWNR